jgi:1,4-dihydroxy-2-naphthoate octaprenyltransferase
VATKKKSSATRPNKNAHHHKKKAAPKPPKVSWIAGARVRTLPLAIAPVAAAAGVVATTKQFSLLLTLLCLAVAVFLQVGVNFANDYSDGIRGTDAFRVGPARLTGSGAKKPEAVRNVAFAFFALAAVAGLIVTVVSAQWWFLAVGAAAILAAWFYTGGKRPYGYSGLGELFVFIFFGPVAVEGTVFVQTKHWSSLGLYVGAAVGLLACAVLMINNIRDIETDVHAGKKTLAVRLGKRVSVIVFCAMVALPMIAAGFIGLLYPVVLYAQFVWLALLPAGVIAVMAKSPGEYILVLKITSFATLAFGALVGLGLWL